MMQDHVLVSPGKMQGIKVQAYLSISLSWIGIGLEETIYPPAYSSMSMLCQLKI